MSGTTHGWQTQAENKQKENNNALWLSGEKKERKNTNNRSPAAIQPWYIYTRRCFNHDCSNHDISIRAAVCGRGHGCASSNMIDGLIWLPGNVSCASLMAWVPSTCWGVWNKHANKFLIKKYKIQHENIKIFP